MISVDQLEYYLRTVPAYFLFGGLALYIYSWIEKKPKISLWGEVVFVVLGMAAAITMLSGMIPDPKTEGLVQEEIEMVLKMLILIVLTGVFSAISLIIRFTTKKLWKPIIMAVFAVAILVFFVATKLSKVNFQLNIPEKTEQAE